VCHSCSILLQYVCSLVNSLGVLLSVCSKLIMYINFILGPGNVHFDYGQDVYFIKPSREYPSQSGMTRDAERRLFIVLVVTYLMEILAYAFNSISRRAKVTDLLSFHCSTDLRVE